MNRESQAAKDMTAAHMNVTAPRPSPYIVIEITDDPHTRRSLEVACFDLKFHYSNVRSKDPLIHPAPGKTFYRIFYTDVIQLFWLGTLFQSQQTKP